MNLNCTGRQWRVSHWWGPRKPWRDERRSSASFYFAQIRGLPSNATPCLRRLSEMRSRLIDAGRWGEDDTFSNVPFDQARAPAPQHDHYVICLDHLPGNTDVVLGYAAE